MLEPLVPTKSHVTYAAWESYSADTSLSIGRAQSNLLSQESRHASVKFEADDVSVGHVSSVRQASMLSDTAQKLQTPTTATSTQLSRQLAPEQPIHKQRSLFGSFSLTAPLTTAATADEQLGHVKSILRQSSMYNSFTQKQPLTATVTATSAQLAQQLDCRGLKFSNEQGGLEWDSASALTALAEGQARCAVTGDAFEHLLQCGDLSMLEAVMRNVVVFARMRSYQKGQVMDLLTIRGLYQMHMGQVRHIQVSSTSNRKSTACHTDVCKDEVISEGIGHPSADQQGAVSNAYGLGATYSGELDL